jgi:hypothetical protein
VLWYILNYSMELTGLQLLKKFPTFYGIRMFITVFTSARHLSLSWASLIQSIPPQSHFLMIHLNIILPSTPGSPQRSLSLRFPYQNPVHISPLPHTRYMPRPSHSSSFYHSHNIGWAVDIYFIIIILVGPVAQSVWRLSYGLGGPEIESWWKRDFLHLSRQALWPTQPPVQGVPVLSRG